MRRAAALAVVFYLCSAGAGVAAGSDPAERLPDVAQEARARHLFTTLRCVVCQNESIDDSNAELAGDLRRIVRRQVAEGRTDAQIRQFLVARYGPFILLKPPFDPANALLWLAPVLVLGLGGAYLVRQGVKPRVDDGDLTEDEASALQALTVDDAVPPHRRRNSPLGGTASDFQNSERG
jgi:cytochrome c-type biogenesis protein CcmH